MKNIKKLSIVLVLAIVATLFAGCGNPIESISFTETEAKTKVEQTYQVEYSVTPADIENPELKWESSNTSVATVDENGLVTAIAEGEVDITATAKKDVSATVKLTVGPKFCDETDEVKIEGLYVDEAYKDKDSSSNKLVYMFYTIKSPKSNLSVDSKGTVMTIDGGNTYTSERYHANPAKVHEYTSSYYFSDYLKNVNVGESLKIMESFLIPAAELEKGKQITFSSTEFEATEAEITMDTDSIVFCKTPEGVAKKADKKGYNAEMKKRAKANDSKTKKVRNLVNGYYWTFFVNSSTYKLEFSSPNKFEVTIRIGGSGMSNHGTYSVREGYIYLNYGNDKDPAVVIPYEIKGSDIELDVTSGFDVRG